MVLFSIIALFSLLILDRLAVTFAGVIPEFNRYLDANNIHGRTTGLSSLSLLILIIYLAILITAWWFLFRKRNEEISYRRVLKNFGIFKKRRYIDVLQIDSNFLAYATIIVIVARVAGSQMEVSSRIGYYFYVFAFTLLGRSISKIKSKRNQFYLQIIIYVTLSLFFIVTGHIFGSESYYGVVPYEFFWN